MYHHMHFWGGATAVAILWLLEPLVGKIMNPLLGFLKSSW